MQTLKSFIFHHHLCLPHIPGRAESFCRSADHTAEDGNLTKVTCCYRRSLRFHSFESCKILDFIYRESQPITSLFPPTATFTYLKLSDEITRWQRSSCLSTVLSVYLLLEQEGRPNLHNSLPAAPSKDDSAQTLTPERGNVLHGAVCLYQTM